MSKIRVSELAKELGINAAALRRLMEGLGIRATSQTQLTEDEVRKTREAAAVDARAVTDLQQVRPTVRRRRRKSTAGAPAPEPESATAQPIPAVTAAPAVSSRDTRAAEVTSVPTTTCLVATLPTFAREEDVLSSKAELEEAALSKIVKVEPVVEPTVEPTVPVPVAVEPEPQAEPVTVVQRIPQKHTSAAFMPKTFAMDDVIPGYTEMEAERKREAQMAAQAKDAPATTTGAKPGVDEQDIEAFKEAFGKAKKKRGAGRKVARSQDLKLRRGIVTEDFGMRGPRKRRKARRSGKSSVSTTVPAKAAKRVVKMSGGITVSELASQLSVKASDLLRRLMELGVMVTINQSLDAETAELVADDFGFTLENAEFDIAAYLAPYDETECTPQARPPVVTIMGHVDHGKTSLLDQIRSGKKHIVDQEAGGITQHIGAYVVNADSGQDLVFLDTPGHEAFTAMRARGASVTDLVVLVVAADDGVKPQTVEAINHAKASGVPIIVAVNKIDKDEARPDRVRQELTEHGLVPEQWGGETSFVDLSAKTGKGVDDLLEILALQAEMLELKAARNRPASGVVIESRLDRARGPVATVIIQRGTLNRGDVVVAGGTYGRVRTLCDDQGVHIETADPGYPVEISGWNRVPGAGQTLHVLADERGARTVADHFAQEVRRKEMAASARPSVSLEDLQALLQTGKVKELNVIIKTDVQGSMEAIRDSLLKIEHPEIKVTVLHSAVGGITESDVQLAATAGGVVIGFNVRADAPARQLAEQHRVTVRTYTVIYELLDDIRAALQGMLAPTIEEKIIGSATVRQVFNITKVGTIAGSYVDQGHVTRNCLVRLFRDNVKVYEGHLSTLKRFKDDAREVQQGYECGVGLENFNDIKVGDVIEAYQETEVATALSA